MKTYIFVIATLLASTNAVSLNKDLRPPKPLDGVKPVSWEPETLPDCPSGPKTQRTDIEKGEIIKYPFNGANCRVQVPSENVTLIMMKDINTSSFEHCPDQTNDDRQTLLDGKTTAVKCPADGTVVAGCNCFETTGM